MVSLKLDLTSDNILGDNLYIGNKEHGLHKVCVCIGLPQHLKRDDWLRVSKISLLNKVHIITNELKKKLSKKLNFDKMTM